MGGGLKRVSGEQLWRHSQMKSNLIVITVAAALITTTVRIIQPPYSSVAPPTPIAPTPQCCLNWT